MDGFLHDLKHSVVEAVKNIAIEALHLNDENADHGGGGNSYSTGNGPHGSSWEPTPHQGQEGGFRHDQGDYEQPEWRRHAPEQPSGGSWAQVVGDEGADNHQISGSHGYCKPESESWQPAGRTNRPHSHPNEEQMGAFRQDASNQQYAAHASADVTPTREELSDISAACNRLWNLDLNRLTPGRDYEIDCGEGKKTYSREDMTGNSLFRFLDPNVFKRSTYARFYALLGNYHADESISEQLTSTAEQEQRAFLEEISRTAPMQYVLEYLAEKNILSSDMTEFKQRLHTLWFKFYGRGGTRNASSAFEHVFVGEITHEPQVEVSGFHNWIQFYVEEAKGAVNYQGYILPRRHGEFPDSHSQLLTIRFDWNGVHKNESSTLIGVSPEFEVALYTLCFFAGQEENYVQLGPYRVNVKCYRLGQDKIGSAFPIALD